MPIRTKLFLNITLLIILFVVVSWALSALFLEEFYLWQKKSSLVTNARTLAAAYNTGMQDIELELERVGSSLGASIIIADSEDKIKYSSFGRLLEHKFAKRHQQPSDGAEPPDKPPKPPLFLTSQENIDGFVLEHVHDQGLNVDFLILKHRLYNSDFLEIRLPLAAVAESATYASRFIFLTGLISILAGSLWAYCFARKFTVPLSELSQIAHGISQLDFSRKCSIRSNDEIGDLAQSINNLSQQLNKAISDLNEKNRKLLADVERERQLDKLRKDFISGVSHDLKTPISLILGYAEGLMENVADDAAAREYYCSVILDEAQRMDRLVKDLLDLSQIESGYFRLNKTNFDLIALLDDIIYRYRSVLAEKNITLDIVAPATMMVNGDTLRIEQVIVNLLNNAIDHVEPPNLIRIDTSECNGKCRLCVFNTGKHIPNDSLPNLWLSFYKVDTARTRDLGGHGLGLSIVRAIQERHGNVFGVENIADGVNFWFEIDRV